MARASHQAIRGHPNRGHPRSILSRQRCRMDHGTGWQGNYSAWLEQKQTRLQQEEKTETQRQKTLERELEWIRMSPKGRHAKGKARINQYESLLEQESQEKINELEIYIPAGPRLG